MRHRPIINNLEYGKPNNIKTEQGTSSKGSSMFYMLIEWQKETVAGAESRETEFMNSLENMFSCFTVGTVFFCELFHTCRKYL